MGLILVTMGAVLAGCDLFKPKDDFTGVIKNITEYRVYAWNPGNHAEVFQLDPGQYFSATLRGSEKYRFKAWLPDGTVISDFVARINQVSDDAPVNDVHVDWVWIIGGTFIASVNPRGDADAVWVGLAGCCSEGEHATESREEG